MPGRRAARRAAVASVSTLVALVCLESGVGTTSAAWTDAATFAAPVSAGTWTTASSAPVVPGPGVAVAVVWTKDDDAYSAIQVCATVTVSSASTTPVGWEFDLDTAVPPWNGTTSGYGIESGSAAWSDDDGLIRVVGTSDSGQAVSAGTPRTIRICNYGLTPIPDAASSGYYTVSTARGTWTSSEACVVTTVSGNGGQQFYFDWSATVDLTAAFAHLAVVDAVAQDDAWGVSITPALSPGRATYTVTSQVPGWAAGAIAGTGTYHVTICAHDY